MKDAIMKKHLSPFLQTYCSVSDTAMYSWWEQIVQNLTFNFNDQAVIKGMAAGFTFRHAEGINSNSLDSWVISWKMLKGIEKNE